MDVTGPEFVFVVVEEVTDGGEGVVQVTLVEDLIVITCCGAVDEVDVTVRLRVPLSELP